MVSSGAMTMRPIAGFVCRSAPASPATARAVELSTVTTGTPFASDRIAATQPPASGFNHTNPSNAPSPASTGPSMAMSSNWSSTVRTNVAAWCKSSCEPSAMPTTGKPPSATIPITRLKSVHGGTNPSCGQAPINPIASSRSESSIPARSTWRSRCAAAAVCAVARTVSSSISCNVASGGYRPSALPPIDHAARVNRGRVNRGRVNRGTGLALATACQSLADVTVTLSARSVAIIRETSPSRPQ